jgi:trans-aconitate methyltransferase
MRRPFWPGLRRAAAALLLAVVVPGAWAQASTGAASTAPPALPFASDEEVPFITTPDRVTLAMLELARVGPADTLVDLGSGDGRIVITAAKRFGARGLGVEIVPDLVARSQVNAKQAGVAGLVDFRVQDLFDTDLAGFSVITMYLLPEVNLKLRPRLLALPAGTRIVSHDWDLGDWAPDRTLTVAVPEKAIGREKLSRLHLWTVPASVQGLWCGPGGATLQLQQRYQVLSALLTQAGLARSYSGRQYGTAMELLGEAGTRWQATVDGELLRGGDATATLPWRRAGTAGCG